MIKVVNESLNKLTEGGIYAMPIDKQNAVIAFEDKLNEIFNVDTISLTYDKADSDLELIPARGFASTEPWFRVTIYGLDDVIYNFMTNEYKIAANNHEIVINPYSDITIDGWNKKDAIDGVTLDYTDACEFDISDINNESNRIGKEIIDMIYNHYDELTVLLLDYANTEEEYAESLIENITDLPDENEKIAIQCLANIAKAAEVQTVDKESLRQAIHTIEDELAELNKAYIEIVTGNKLYKNVIRFDI